LRIWQLRLSDEASLSTTLPAEDSISPRPKPWLLHTLPVNTLNFCAFSMCHEHVSEAFQSLPAVDSEGRPAAVAEESILIATPAADDKKINVYQFPDERLRYMVPKVLTADTGQYLIPHVSNPVSKLLPETVWLNIHCSIAQKEYPVRAIEVPY
jgi:hypothetical protein